MKKISVLLLITLMLLSTACDRVSYTSDLSCGDVANAVLSRSSKEFVEYESYYTDYIISDRSLYNDSTILYSIEVNDIDEIGIFRATDKENAKILEQMLCEYIDDMRITERAFIESYAPDELPKLDGATVRRFGNYVVYIIVPTDKRAAVLDTIDEILRK